MISSEEFLKQPFIEEFSDLEIVDGFVCEECYFSDKNVNDCIAIACRGDERSDNRSVIFIKKVGSS